MWTNCVEFKSGFPVSDTDMQKKNLGGIRTTLELIRVKCSLNPF